jgi:hypothetical protein
VLVVESDGDGSLEPDGNGSDELDEVIEPDDSDDSES